MVKGSNESGLTVALAFAANVLIAAAKSAAAAVTGSASMVAEAAHSWADTGNEVLLMVANQRSRRAADINHPLGYGREAYIWSMFAALGLFALGAGVSVTHGVQELLHPEPAADFTVAYLVLGVSAVLEGISFRQSVRQLRSEAPQFDRTLLEHAVRTSDPTTRAVFAEDGGALVGLLLAFLGILLHQLTGYAGWDALGSIAVGLLLAVIAIVLVDRNRRFLVGVEASPTLRAAIIATLLAIPEVERVTFLRTEYLGPKRIYLVASIDLRGDEVESQVAERLRAIAAELETDEHVVRAVLSLSTADQPSIVG
ncbi:cation diffusion facilitator family transporter [Skermania sp. ID1734]|uniref:cation diffusion facilitator family transporter n=1 Tax=Skermania sp. ID1734 TaxID=2597516 RepID=UPI00117C156A|nr:cation diffusion facilitator family transporter [Skermania sp. ID1734]TSD98111.1 cation diffusion facilitator family transporter [Skermania sp. ID1734]